MEKIFAVFLLTPLWSLSQKITRDIRPDSHQVWLVTDDVDLNFRIILLRQGYFGHIAYRTLN